MLFTNANRVPKSNGRTVDPSADVFRLPNRDQPIEQPVLEARAGFSAASLLRKQRGIQISFPANSLAVALGTTAGRVLQGSVRRLCQECGRLPAPAGYLIIDAAQPSDDIDSGHFIPIGHTGDGVGTLPENGRQAFEADADRIRDAISRHVDGLFTIDHRFVPMLSAQQLIHVNIVAGCGGTSGGSLIPCFKAINSLLGTRGVQKVRFNITIIGPEIVTNDVSRQSSMDTRAPAIIYQTFALNYRYFHQLACLERSSTSVSVVDRSNRTHLYAQMNDFEPMLAESLFLRWYTKAGTEANARQCDTDQIDQDFQ